MSIFKESRQIYGSYTIAIELNKSGISLSRSSIGRRTQTMGISSRTRKRLIATTDSRHENPVADHVLDRNFTPSQLGKAWGSEITYGRLKAQGDT